MKLSNVKPRFPNNFTSPSKNCKTEIYEKVYVNTYYVQHSMPRINMADIQVELLNITDLYTTALEVRESFFFSSNCFVLTMLYAVVDDRSVD